MKVGHPLGEILATPLNLHANYPSMSDIVRCWIAYDSLHFFRQMSLVVGAWSYAVPHGSEPIVPHSSKPTDWPRARTAGQEK